MVLKAIGLDDRIDFLQPLEPGMHSKAESLRSLLERVKPSFAVMVGDTLLDCEAAAWPQSMSMPCTAGTPARSAARSSSVSSGL